MQDRRGYDPYTRLSLPAPTQMAMPSLLAEKLRRHWSLVEDVVGTTERRFIQTLFATLQYVRHRGVRERETMTGAQLFWLLERLSCIVKVFVLKDLGFDDEKVRQIVAGNAQVAHLKTITAPWEDRNAE